MSSTGMHKHMPVGGWNLNANLSVGDKDNRRDSGSSIGNNRNQFLSHSTPTSTFSLNFNDKHQIRMSPKQNKWGGRAQPGSPLPAISSSNVDDTPHQLSNIKKQWNVERDIPSGAVKNNPFVPKQEIQAPPAPPPQLMHQKRQWDTTGIIQRGSVAARAMSMEIEREEGLGPSLSWSSSSRMSPVMQQHHHRFGHGLASPAARSPAARSPSPVHMAPTGRLNRRSFPLDDASRTPQHQQTLSSARLPANGVGLGATTSTTPGLVATGTPFKRAAGQVGTPSLSEQANGAHPVGKNATTTKWEPSKEIPKGMVKGRLDKLLSPTATTTGPHRDDAQRPKENGHERRFHYDDTDDDPWIISAEKARPAQVFAGGNWGEALAVKSEESDDWDSPATDWLKSSESQTSASAETGYATNQRLQPETKHLQQNFSKLSHRKRFNLGVVDEKKIDEEDPAQDHIETRLDTPGRTHEVARGEEDLFETTHQRDEDILRAARQKTKSQQKIHKPFVDVLQVFDSEAHADQDGFPAQPFEQDVFKDAFPSSPFGGHSNFGDFSADDRSSLQEKGALSHPPQSYEKNSNIISYDDDFVDAIDADKADYQTGALEETLKNAPETSRSRDDELEDSPPRKQKKGFFNKLFGGARKTRKSSGSESKKQHGNDDVHELHQEYEPIDSEVGVALAHQITKLSTSMEMQAEYMTQVTYEPSVSPKLASGRSEDDTTISEMTLPTVFKDHTKPANEKTKIVIPVMESPDEREDQTEDLPVLEPSHEQKVTAGDVYHDDPGLVNITSDSETEGTADAAVNRGTIITSNQEVDLRPPPPPPPSRTQEQGVFDAGGVQELGLGSQNHLFNTTAPPSSTSSTSGHQYPSPLESARFTRRVKEFRSNTMRHHQTAGTRIVNKEDQSEKRVPGFVARHSKKKAQAHSSRASVETAGPNGSMNKTENKASRAFEHSQMPRGLSRGSTSGSIYQISSGSMDRQGVKPMRAISGRSAMIEGGGSGRSSRSFESSSVGSDIRVLRTILRRPRRESATVLVNRPKPVFATYDENSISDPMQRAGLRLLSAAIIPIQTEVRRFLAMRQALTRMWALIVIQAAARRWMARRDFVKDMDAIVKVQAFFRGNQERGDLIYKHICAIEIQRVVRGYLATVRVYEDIYKVTMVQSYVRMKMAMVQATNRMALLIQLQAVARGFVVRRRLEYKEACAVAIQANWRCFLVRLTYQFDLLDIIIVQSVWRRRKAVKEVQRARDVAFNNAATLIQAKWRSYDCTMNYLHFLADVLIVQSTVRRFLVLKRVWKIRQDAATKIQSVWRGFVSYADFMFSLADIVVVQKVARRWLATRRVKQMRNSKYNSAKRIQRVWRSMVFRRERENAAVAIQKCWRCFVDETEFVVMKYEHYAARTIQTYWRRFFCFSNFIISLDSSIQIQSAYRGYRERMEIQKQNLCATQIQRGVRRLLAKNEVESMVRREKISVAAQEQAEAETFAARRIQSVVRGHQARTAVRLYVCARRIQAIWRAKRIHTAYRFYRAALMIQTRYRGMRARRDLLVVRGENLAATLIQSAWRGFVCYTDYIFTISDIISAQKTARRFLAQTKYAWQIRDRIMQNEKEKCASTAMQRVCRGFIARQRYWYTLGCIMQIQRWIRARLLINRLRREAWARLKLQCFARTCLSRQEYLQRKFIMMLLRTADQERTKRVAATVIQERCRGYLEDRKREDAARTIQRFFLLVKSEVDQMVKARKRRKTWRKKTRNRNCKVEDALLEDAWASAVSHSNLSRKPTAISASSSQDSGPNENLGANVGLSHRGSGDLGNESRLKGYNVQSGDTVRSMKPKLPPRYAEKPSSVLRLHHDDDRSEYSGLTASTAYTRIPVSRSKRLNRREMDEDLELEEAFIDAEIFSAKERRLAPNGSMSHVGIALRGSTKLNVFPNPGSYV